MSQKSLGQENQRVSHVPKVGRGPSAETRMLILKKVLEGEVKLLVS